MTTSSPVKPGSDLRDSFRRAYENRYTWDAGFGGYSGRCIWEQGDQRVEKCLSGFDVPLLHVISK